MPFVVDGWATDEFGRGWRILWRDHTWLLLKAIPGLNPVPYQGPTDEPWLVKAKDFHHFTGQAGC